MRQCIFQTCKSRPDDRVGNTALVHRFPIQEHMRKLWIQWVREKCNFPDFEFSVKDVLCYRHFERQCHNRSDGLLKPFSYPSFTPQDLDNISTIGPSSREISMNGVPKTNLVIKLDPTLVKNSTEKPDQGKKFVLVVTDNMQTSQSSNTNVSSISPKQPGIGIVRPQDIPPLRLFSRDKTASTVESIPLNQDKSPSTVKNNICFLQPQLSKSIISLAPSPDLLPSQKTVCVSQDALSNQCLLEKQSVADSPQEEKSLSRAPISRSPHTSKVVQTILESSRRRIRVYRRRLQQERRKLINLKTLLEEMKEKKIISVSAAQKIESVLHDD